MALSTALELPKCYKCDRPLRDADIKLVGVTLHPPPTYIFFDYVCPCGHCGRRFAHQEEGVTATGALLTLADMVAGAADDNCDLEAT